MMESVKSVKCKKMNAQFKVNLFLLPCYIDEAT